jgi:hypothetical protein
MTRKSKLKEYGDEALTKLLELMRNSSSDQVKVAAARELLDRALGRPRSESAGDDGPTLQEMIRRAYERTDR